MIKFSYFGILVSCIHIASLTGGGCARQGQSIKSPVVATINGESITLEELSNAIKNLIPEEGTESHSEDARTLREQVLDQLIEKKLLLQETKQRGIQLSEQEIALAVEQMRGDYTDEEFEKLLKASGLTPDLWKREVTENLLIDRLMDTVLSARLSISEGEVKQFYHKHREEFEKKGEVRARQIVVATEEEAKGIHQQLLGGANFVQLATEKSISPDKANGGDLGFFTKGQMPEEFDIVFAMKVNSISPVVKSPYGFHIFKVEEKRSPRFQTLEEVREAIFQQLISEKEEHHRSEWIKELKSKADIKINASLLHQQDEPEKG